MVSYRKATLQSHLKKQGFTLIEMLVTISIVAILATIAMPLNGLSTKRSKETELRQALRDIRNAVDAYKLASDEGRITRTIDDSGYPPNLETLVKGVDDAKSPNKRKLYFLRRIPQDPISGKSWGLRSYDSPPDAPREGKDVFDVYSQSEQIGLNGIPYRAW